MVRPRLLRLVFPVLLACALGAGPAARAEPFGPGKHLDRLTVGTVTYQQVEILSVNARTVVIRHAGGMASVHLRDLAPEWQARFHYDPAADAAPAPVPTSAFPPPLPAATPAREDPLPAGAFEALLQRFGQTAPVQAEIDLRPKFIQLELGVKNQGRRPSCSIFAVVSALEFLNAQLVGHPEKFSEEYLIWAVRRTVQRTPLATAEGAKEDVDEGFSLGEVVAALRAYGIPLQSSMPNTFGRKIESIEDPPAAVVREARAHERVFFHTLPGRDPITRINNLVHVLNAGIPVPVGMAWPNYRSLRNGYLSEQKPLASGGHAVTLVGYRCPTGRLEDAVFIFKNSWGVDWGQGGYGMVTFSYLSRHLNDAVLLEVQRAGS